MAFCGRQFGRSRLLLVLPISTAWSEFHFSTLRSRECLAPEGALASDTLLTIAQHHPAPLYVPQYHAALLFAPHW